MEPPAPAQPRQDPPAADELARAPPDVSASSVSPPARSDVAAEQQSKEQISLSSLQLDAASDQRDGGGSDRQERIAAQDKGKGKAVGPEEQGLRTLAGHEPHPSSPEAVEVPLGEDPLSTAAPSDDLQQERPPSPRSKLLSPLEPEEEWPLKSIAFPPLPPPPSSSSAEHDLIETGPRIKIICQNRNGPCSFIALCNVLILRSSIFITPSNRKSVTYSYLSSLVGDYLLSVTSAPSSALSLEAALSILPSTRYGLNLNPRFGGIDGFRPASEGGELALFKTAQVPLLHGWVVDPQDEETWHAVVEGEGAGDYDAVVERVVEADVIIGEEPGEDEAKMLEAVQRRSLWTEEQEEKVRQAHLIRKFLTSSQTQLTYHGLFLLSSSLAPGSLSALFRNSHLSVLYRRPSLPSSSNGPQLFTLVTDESFAGEQEVVWESLEDVEGGMSEFFDSALRRSSPRGGDWVPRRRGGSQTQNDEARRQKEESRAVQEDIDRFERLPSPDNDFALAQQLQHEEDYMAHQASLPPPQSRADRVHAAAERAPAVLAPGALSVGPEAIAGLPAASAGKGGSRAEREKERAKSKKGSEKDKCVVS